MKKHLSAAFSSRALIEQESIVSAVLDRFVDRMGLETTDAEGVNVTKWFEMVSFDVLGEMAFGESFGCIESGKSTDTHNQHSAVCSLGLLSATFQWRPKFSLCLPAVSQAC